VQACGQLAIFGMSAALVAFGSSIINAPLGNADCTNAGGVTVCAQGEVRGSSSGSSGSTGPYFPYPCEADYLCNDSGVSIVLDPDLPIDPPDFGRPGRPDIGAPGRPGNRPDGGGRGGGNRGGGGRR
jgi:hypothetical protein